MRDEVAAGVDDGDVHRLANLGGLGLPGGEDALGVGQRDRLSAIMKFPRLEGFAIT